MQLRNLTIPGGAAFAPMAGLSDAACRRLMADHGAAWTVSEMASAKAITFGDRKSLALLRDPDPHGLYAVQLFGNEPELLGQAIGILREKGVRFDLLDLNMGCPAPKITGGGAGSKLMLDPPLCGADLLVVHGRTREQMYVPPVHWDQVAAVKRAVGIPVFANGDITSPERAVEAVRETGCDGVMIGRGALGDPWLFERVNAALAGQTPPLLPTLPQRMAALRRQIYEMCEEKGEWAAMPQARSQAMHYMKGLRGAAALRRACAMLSRFEDVDTLIDAVYRCNE